MFDFPTIPDFLRIDQETRRAAWKGRRLTKVRFDIDRIKKTEDASTRAFRKMIEKQQAEKKAAALKHLRENYGPTSSAGAGPRRARPSAPSKGSRRARRSPR